MARRQSRAAAVAVAAPATILELTYSGKELTAIPDLEAYENLEVSE